MIFLPDQNHILVKVFREMSAMLYNPIYWVITNNSSCSLLTAIGVIFAVGFVHTHTFLSFITFFFLILVHVANDSLVFHS